MSNLTNNLIKKCICDNTSDFSEKTENDIELLECNICGVSHQILRNFTELDLDNFYTKQYHVDYQKKKNVITYQDRYAHDRSISKIRLSAYQNFISPGMKGIDIGSSNSAFIHECLDSNIDCIGLEPGESVGDPAVTIRGRLETVDLPTNQFDFATLHDAVEHMIDPVFSLKKVFEILKPNGLIIVDLPDFYIPEGKHHWKPVEHLWYFTEEEFVNLLKISGFDIIKIDRPIPGKLVFYGKGIMRL